MNEENTPQVARDKKVQIVGRREYAAGRMR
jgi:hypothetical protein